MHQLRYMHFNYERRALVDSFRGWVLSGIVGVCFISACSAQLVGGLVTPVTETLAPVLTVLEPQPTTAIVVETTVVQAPQQASQAPQVTTVRTTNGNVLVTQVVQTTFMSSSSIVVTSQYSLAVLPTITRGATTISLNSETYVVSVGAGGSMILSGNGANGTWARMSTAVIDGKTVIYNPASELMTQTIFGTSVIVETTSVRSTHTAAAGENKGSGLVVGAGLGIGIGAMALLMIIAGFILCFMRRRRKKARAIDDDDQSYGDTVELVGDDGTRKLSVVVVEADSNPYIFEKSEMDGASVCELPGDAPPLSELYGDTTLSGVVSPLDADEQSTLSFETKHDMKTAISPIEPTGQDLERMGIGL